MGRKKVTAGWCSKRCTLIYLSRRLATESKELREAMRKIRKVAKRWGYEKRDMDYARADLGDEAADVGNFAMMIADVCGALPADPRTKGTR